MNNPNLPPPYGADPLAKFPPSNPQGPPSYPHPQPQDPSSQPQAPPLYPQPYPQEPLSYPQAPTNPYPGAPHTITYIVPTQPITPVIHPVGPHPSHQTCPSCNANIQTRTETLSNSNTHLYAFILCILGCWPCCLIPYCMDDCQSINHYCPNCDAYIGTYKSQ